MVGGGSGGRRVWFSSSVSFPVVTILRKETFFINFDCGFVYLSWSLDLDMSMAYTLNSTVIVSNVDSYTLLWYYCVFFFTFPFSKEVLGVW